MNAQARVGDAAAIAIGFTPSDSENTAIAQGNTHIAEAKGTRRRDLTINALKDAISAKRDDHSSVHRVMSGIARSAHEESDVISTQRTAISDDMDIISIDQLTVSAAELTISDNMDIISIDQLTVSAADLTISDDMDIISIDQLTVSAADLSISADIDKNSPNEAKISTAQGSAVSEYQVSAISPSDLRSVW